MFEVTKARIPRRMMGAFMLLYACFASTGGFAEVLQVDADYAGVVAQLASHSVRGVVRSLDASSLVITRSRRRATELTFVLNPATLRSGTITVGSTVSVRYRKEGDTLIATAVTAHTTALVAQVP